MPQDGFSWHRRSSAFLLCCEFHARTWRVPLIISGALLRATGDRRRVEASVPMARSGMIEADRSRAARRCQRTRSRFPAVDHQTPSDRCPHLAGADDAWKVISAGVPQRRLVDPLVVALHLFAWSISKATYSGDRRLLHDPAGDLHTRHCGSPGRSGPTENSAGSRAFVHQAWPILMWIDPRRIGSALAEA